jgi:2-keto-4-pentenoate hydratase/2-oxohepta-3-ene-1,7-dioic acid hydratase in catechol pathway
MKIAQFFHEGVLRLGVVQGDQLFPLAFQGDMKDFIRSGSQRPTTAGPFPIGEAVFAPAVTAPSKIMAIGLNYKDHAEEGKGKVPEAPIVFAKFPSSLLGHGQTIAWDQSVTKKVDFEAELAVVIGKEVHHCPEDRAMEAVFGYCCANDVSARDLQFGDGQWVRGKSLDTFCPLGPWVVTADEIPDPHALSIRCELNGHAMQDSSTGLMIFKVATLVSYLSKHFTLFPGDLILTGTPAGVGAFREPSVYMQDGDEVVVEIQGIGRLVNTCKVR